MHTHIYLGNELLMKLDYTLPATEGRNILLYDTMYVVLDILLDLNVHPHKMVVHVFDPVAQHDAELAESEPFKSVGIPATEKSWLITHPVSLS